MSERGTESEGMKEGRGGEAFLCFFFFHLPSSRWFCLFFFNWGKSKKRVQLEMILLPLLKGSHKASKKRSMKKSEVD